MRAAEREVVEADVVELAPFPRQGPGDPTPDVRDLTLIEEQAAEPIAMNSVEDRIFGLAFVLEQLGLYEEAQGFFEGAG